ncbi:hypothetical protein ASPZODRAFT_139504 [Penicilliopsis zonata CBS 506.65]|uniref:Uncharacterized protein n=1 Tax=Penicilliopsis zonata CBS 506.65 TaxID=1073090 RepID=A0A1L9SST0_9EURO|nr:hypothetical protein ASPZODRAFT_139504 [Penicilliopsis zonata CBS 506.65]OJJ50186.1 hypothetical protein ASPZODRAFT_139504 [Penicilliopsis zonata CBS 506.65]
MTRRGRSSLGANFQNPDYSHTPDKGLSTSTKTPVLRRKTSSPFPSLSTTKSRKKTTGDSLPSGPRQSTLTQIDFVTRTQGSESDDGGLDYIQEDQKLTKNGGNSKEVITIEDSSQNDPDYQPLPPPRTRQVRNVHFEQADVDDDLDDPTPKRRRVSTPSEKRAKKKNTPPTGNGKNRSMKKGKDGKKEKTLTQIGYVRRYLPVESDDLDLDYTSYTPYDRDTKKEHNGTPKEIMKVEQKGSEIEGAMKPFGKALVTASMSTATATSSPVTPRKSRKFEIPSSQSPDSPGFAMIAASQRQCAGGSPLKNVSPDLLCQRSEEGSRFQRVLKEESLTPTRPPLLVGESTISDSSMLSNSPIANTHAVKDAKIQANDPKGSHQRDLAIHENIPAEEKNQERVSHRAFEKTVVYETDAESEYEDLDGEMTSTAGSSPKQTVNSQQRRLSDNEQDSSAEDDLPLPLMHSELDLDETVLPPSEATLSSDASVYYRRLQPATQYPLEPIPMMNTQQLAELFPRERGGPSTSLNDFTLVAMANPSTTLHPQVGSPAQSQLISQPETQSQDMQNLDAEVVPESSPLRHEIRHPAPSGSSQAYRQSVIQVESSQPADRLKRRETAQGRPYRPLFSKSQLLSSSVMESIPMPQFILGSQDSVGEPYSMDDKEGPSEN